MAAAMLLGLTAAGTATSETSTSAADLYRRTELFFGSSKPDGSVVSPEQFELFLDKEVTPAFPDGLTWVEAHGQWMGGKEDSFVLILLYPLRDREANGEIEEIRTDYKKQFQQQSVLRTDSAERVSF